MMENSIISTTRRAWFFRGAVVAVLVTGTLNALSYFVRSRGWGSLLGGSPSYEAIGFPLPLWENGHTGGVYSMDNPGFLANFAFSFGLSVLFGLITLRFVAPLNRLVARIEPSAPSSGRFQFTLKGLFLITLAASIAAAAGRTLAWSPVVLGGIYLFGPLSLLIIAMVPRRMRWQQRAVIIMLGSFMLISLALAVGIALKIEIDKVLLGIYACWTPQSVIGAIALTVALLYRHRYDMLPDQPVTS